MTEGAGLLPKVAVKYSAHVLEKLKGFVRNTAHRNSVELMGVATASFHCLLALWLRQRAYMLVRCTQLNWHSQFSSVQLYQPRIAPISSDQPSSTTLRPVVFWPLARNPSFLTHPLRANNNRLALELIVQYNNHSF